MEPQTSNKKLEQIIKCPKGLLNIRTIMCNRVIRMLLYFSKTYLSYKHLYIYAKLVFFHKFANCRKGNLR